MFLPRTTETAVSYFLCVGLHRSITRPRTPYAQRRRRPYTAEKQRRTWKNALQIGQSLLHLDLPLSFFLVYACLQQLVMYVNQLFVDLSL